MASNIESLTLVKDAIHNPADARHFMRLGRPTHRISASCRGIELANSTQTIKVKEIGYDIYDPVIYFPRSDVQMARLVKNAKSTHCPLKGDTEYFDLVDADISVENIAWSYNSTIEIAKALQDFIGFDQRHVQLVEYTVAE